jgi:hypothetical protein
MKPCVMCGDDWRMGDRAVVIGNVTSHGMGELRFAHIRCMLANVLGDAAAEGILDQRPELR